MGRWRVISSPRRIHRLLLVTTQLIELERWRKCSFDIFGILCWLLIFWILEMSILRLFDSNLFVFDSFLKRKLFLFWCILDIDWKQEAKFEKTGGRKWFRETGKNEPIKVCNNVKKVVQKVIPKFSVCNLSKRGAIYFVTSKTLKDEVWEIFFWMNMVQIDLRIWEYQFEGTLKISAKRHCLNQCIGKDLNLLGEKNLGVFNIVNAN